MNFLEFMREMKAVDRWFVVKVFIAGAFCGALLAVMWVLFGMVR